MKKIVTVLAILVFSASAYAGEVMKFGFSETLTPYAWQENGQDRGILVDIANEAIQKRMGIAVSYHIYPWERAQHMVREGLLDAHITNGPLRKEWAEYSNEVVTELTWGIFVKAGNPKLEQIKKAKSLEELRPFQFVDYIGNGWAKANLVDKKFDVYLVRTPATIFSLLAKGRGDMNIMPALQGRYYIKEQGLKGQIDELPPIMPPIPFHLVIGKNSPFTKILPEFDKTIRQMKDEGYVQAVIDNYTK
jgi:polar amino acid transport system substrate-binding protein